MRVYGDPTLRQRLLPSPVFANYASCRSECIQIDMIPEGRQNCGDESLTSRNKTNLRKRYNSILFHDCLGFTICDDYYATTKPANPPLANQTYEQSFSLTAEKYFSFLLSLLELLIRIVYCRNAIFGSRIILSKFTSNIEQKRKARENLIFHQTVHTAAKITAFIARGTEQR